MHNHAVEKTVILRLVDRGQQSKLAALRHETTGLMANWHTIDELHDISADLLRFTQAFTELATRLGLDIAPLEADHISLRCHQNATAERWRCVALSSAENCCRRISLTVARSACSNFTRR